MGALIRSTSTYPGGEPLHQAAYEADITVHRGHNLTNTGPAFPLVRMVELELERGIMAKEGASDTATAINGSAGRDFVSAGRRRQSCPSRTTSTRGGG